MKLPSKNLERKLFREGHHHVIGVDEVGMACLAGPVVVCAILFTEQFFGKPHKNLRWLRDSKQLSASQREFFFKELLKEPSLKYQIASCGPAIIDRINIYNAARLAMRKAVTKLVTRNLKLKFKNTSDKLRDIIVLVDGNTKIKGLELPQTAIIKGDQKIFAIACASIIAKVTRDRLMTRYATKYPKYGLEKHKGYPTKLHKTMLIRHGISPIHRKSFAPVAKLV